MTCGVAAAGANTISIRSDEWLPYNGSSARKPPGYMIEMADSIARANGHTIDYRNLPWDDALIAVRRGDFDCVVGATPDEVPDFAFPSEPWGASQTAIFALADSPWRYTDLESLKSQRIAAMPDYSYSEDIDAWIDANRADPTKVVEVTSGGRITMAAVGRLVIGQADIILEDRNVMRLTLRELDLTERVVEKGALEVADPIFIACTPADPRGRRYADLFAAGTVILRQSGALEEILQRYGMADWAAAAAPP